MRGGRRGPGEVRRGEEREEREGRGGEEERGWSGAIKTSYCLGSGEVCTPGTYAAIAENARVTLCTHLGCRT